MNDRQEVVVVSMLVLLTIIAIAAVFVRFRGQRAARLLFLAQELDDGKIHLDRGGVGGKRNGLVVDYRFIRRGSGSDTDPWTQVEVDIPRDYPLTLRIVRGEPEERELRQGTAVDVQVGDPEFDLRFIVEAAPSDVIRQLLDAEFRRFLLSFHAPELDTIRTKDRAALRLLVSGWHDDVPGANRLIDGVGRIASGVRDAYGEANDRIAKQGNQGSPYRPVEDPRPMHDAEAQRAKELATVEAIRLQRAVRAVAGKIAFGIGLVIVGAFVVRIVMR